MFSIAIDRGGRRLLDEARALSDGRPVLVWLGLAASLALAAASLGVANEVPAAAMAPTSKTASRDDPARDIPDRRPGRRPGRRTRA